MGCDFVPSLEKQLTTHSILYYSTLNSVHITYMNSKYISESYFFNHDGFRILYNVLKSRLRCI